MKDLFGRPVVPAAEMDTMTPEQRQESSSSRVVWDLADLPESYVARLRSAAEVHLVEREGGPSDQGSVNLP